MPQATIRDVAAAAGVSVASVSRVVNGSNGVSERVRDRVLAAVAELGYRPNRAARSLRTRAAAVIGLIISDITNPFFTSMVRGVEDAAQAAGFSVVLANADEDLAKELQYLEVAAAEQMAGVVLSPASSRHTSIDLLAERGIPIVTVDRRLRDAGVDSVTVNNQQAACDATTHLIEQGCRQIGFVAGPSETTTAAGRLAGYQEALSAAGRDFQESLLAYGDYRVDGGRAATATLLELSEGIDGLFVSNNLMTIGALQALHERSLTIPGDVALVGFDDMSWSIGYRPSLSLVQQPTYEIGHQAATLLLKRIRGDRSDPWHVVLEANLEVRDSSRRRAKAG